MRVKVYCLVEETALIDESYYKDLIDFHTKGGNKSFPEELANDLRDDMTRLYPEGKDFTVLTEDGVVLLEN